MTTKLPTKFAAFVTDLYQLCQDHGISIDTNWDGYIEVRNSEYGTVEADLIDCTEE